MAENEQKPLLDDENGEIEEHGSVPLPPPPPYEQPKNEVAPPPAEADYGASMPLPTYSQSEKYERDGVLEYDKETADFDAEEEVAETEHQTTSALASGNCCEFMMFFMVCAILSVIGFIFTFCLATTVAAQSGALAGLGVAFISKPILFEMYNRGFMEEQVKLNYCGLYYTGDSVNLCIHRTYSVMRFFLLVVGMLGLFLLYKGTTNFIRSRGSRRN